mgnify:CR=1 FL=1
MITFLSRFFIKDYKDYSSPQVRQSYGMLCGAVGIALNIFLFIGKWLAGILSGSIAITADAFNNLSDAGSSVVTLFIAMGMVSGIQKRSLPDWLR